MNYKKQSDMNNTMLALVVSLLILVVWQYYVEAPREKAEMLAMRAKAQAELQQKKETEAEPAQTVQKSHAELLAESPRVRVASASLHGSIALKGLRFDDLTLAKYRETLAPDSPEVVLFSPAGEKDAYFAEFGWTSADADTSAKLPGSQSVWAADGSELTPSRPVTFTWKNADGAVFTVKIALDDKYMFTVSQSVNAAKPLNARSYAYINRLYDVKAHTALGILHEGPLGVFDGTLKETPYKKLMEEKEERYEAQSGWLGVTDKYWLCALIPAEGPFDATFTYYAGRSGSEHYQASWLGAPQPQTTVRLFAGAKELAVLDAYAAQYHIPLFDRAVDFGMYYFLTKPIFHLLSWFYALTGNFGIAILLLTVIVKALMFPLASKSFRAMNQLKELQPKIKEIQERCKDDKVKLNQEMIAFYKREKVNPASGCLPLLIQIPVFFSLYKVLYVTIEMRHAPFFGWIHDLSAPDPTNLFTLFGLLSWQPPSVLHLGIWPILFCLTMVIQQHQSPPPPDPVQAKMMKLLPFVFLFLFSTFAAGLVIYWCWSNLLSIVQQWYIKKRHAVRKNGK